jgi:thioredoxin reductase (NADPH)
VIVDRHQATNIEGLFAAGDVVLGLDQISNAMGHGGVAATAIRNYISKRRTLLRQAKPTKKPQLKD